MQKVPPPPENHPVYEKMCKHIVESDRPQMKILRMRIACWIPKATSTHSEYVIIIAFPLQQWLHERASVLRYTFKFYVFHPEVFIEYNGQNVSDKHNNNKYKTYNVTTGLHVSTVTESSSGPHDTDEYKECTMHYGI